MFDGKLNRIKPTICIEVENKDFAQNWAEGQKEFWCVKHQKLHFIDIYKAMKHMFKIMDKYQLTMICLLSTCLTMLKGYVMTYYFLFIYLFFFFFIYIFDTFDLIN